jgi:hypothetical protein
MKAKAYLRKLLIGILTTIYVKNSYIREVQEKFPYINLVNLDTALKHILDSSGRYFNYYCLQNKQARIKVNEFFDNMDIEDYIKLESDKRIFNKDGRLINDNYNQTTN